MRRSHPLRIDAANLHGLAPDVWPHGMQATNRELATHAASPAVDGAAPDQWEKRKPE